MMTKAVHRTWRAAWLGALAVCLGLAGCAPPAPVVATPEPPSLVEVGCTDGITTLSADTPGLAMASCASTAPGHFAVEIAPEDPKVTNCSPFYAFAASSAAPARVSVTLSYAKCKHRYRPQVLTLEPGENPAAVPLERWQLLDASKVEHIAREKTTDARLTLDLPAGTTLVSGQELMLPAHYAAWIDRVSASPLVTRSLLGRSIEGRSIEQFVIAPKGKRPGRQVVLLGRQHPPEMTGGVALMAFVARLLEDDALARRYRAAYTTTVVPLLNPDGVVHGNWRHNMGQTDLNRDWGPFTQPETRLVRDMLEAMAADPRRRLRLFLDFHSTHYDTIYTIPDEQETDPPGFTSKWLAEYARLVPDYKLRVEPGHNRGGPVAKGWVHDQYKVPTATYELGDDTDRALIRRVGRAAAESMMTTLLETDTWAP